MLQIRSMLASDADKIASIMTGDEDFGVGPTGLCYTYASVLKIPNDPTWTTLLAFSEDVFVGFAFCKNMTTCWTMLDTFYIFPEYRRMGYGKELMGEVYKKLKASGAPYISVLIDAKRPELIKAMERLNLEQQKTYVWLDANVP